MKKLIGIVLGLFLGLGLSAQVPGIKIIPNISEHVIIDITNETADSTFYNFDLGDYKGYALELQLEGGVTCKAYATLNDTTSIAGSINWVDFNTALFGADSIVDKHVLVFDAAVILDRVLLKFIFSDDSNRIIGILRKRD